MAGRVAVATNRAIKGGSGSVVVVLCVVITRQCRVVIRQRRCGGAKGWCVKVRRRGVGSVRKAWRRQVASSGSARTCGVLGKVASALRKVVGRQ